jgi:DNA repair exonuclease SbcCD ATPase subunit
MVVEPDGSTRIVEELNEEQKAFKAALAAHREKAERIKLDEGACPTCGLKV